MLLLVTRTRTATCTSTLKRTQLEELVACVFLKKSASNVGAGIGELTLMLAIGRPVSSITTSPHWHWLVRVVGLGIAALVRRSDARERVVFGGG